MRQLHRPILERVNGHSPPKSTVLIKYRCLSSSCYRLLKSLTWTQNQTLLRSRFDIRGFRKDLRRFLSSNYSWVEIFGTIYI
ncbi:hypothetical protein LWI29_022536 [Acer saccharum]|uniref:Uncharacterized protein n=1 Tax=Acer saccharum TaxID=4024 RepID=A0AA39TC85_ACESA|nr:hypothetical protein LWI29_022536 [Acer saccharum]